MEEARIPLREGGREGESKKRWWRAMRIRKRRGWRKRERESEREGKESARRREG